MPLGIHNTYESLEAGQFDSAVYLNSDVRGSSAPTDHIGRASGKIGLHGSQLTFESDY